MNALREFAVSQFARPMLNLFTWDELARRSLWDWYDVGPEHVAGVAAEPDAFEQLAVLSAHSNGRVRERAVVALAAHGSRALPWLLLRTVDWVEVVRGVARTAVQVEIVLRPRQLHAGAGSEARDDVHLRQVSRERLERVPGRGRRANRVRSGNWRPRPRRLRRSSARRSISAGCVDKVVR